MNFYRALLHLYPASFRGEYRDELCRLFAERRQRTSGFVAVAALCLETIIDTLVSAARVHLDILRQDLRYTVRSLAHARGFAVTAVLVTALGIGANTAVFSLTDQVFIRPLPYHDADRLVMIWEQVPGYSRLEASPPNYLDWRRMSTSFETMGAVVNQQANMVGGTEPRRLIGANVSAEVLAMLGAQPSIGRTFVRGDDELNAARTVILSDALWRSEFGARPDILGARVRLDEIEHVVIGVMPPAFSFPSRETQIWRPLLLSPDNGDEDRDNNYLHVLARLKPGATLGSARAEMEVLTERLERAYPTENAETRATVHLLRDQVPSQARMLMYALGGASACFLLIACTNLASLLLARVLKRRKELAMRTAMGAGRERLVRQLLTESLVLSVAGGALGIVFAIIAVPLLALLVPPSLPIADATALDTRVLLFAALLTAVTGIAFGVVPAVRVASDRDLSGLREGSRGGSGGRTERLRALLVAAEVAISVVLLISAGLLIRALWRVQTTDPGFRTERVIAIQTPLSQTKYGVTARRVDLYSRILQDVRALPGVDSAAYISFIPMSMRGGIWPVKVKGTAQIPEELGDQRAASLRYVTPGFFRTMQIPLHAGRDISESDTLEANAVAVVSQSFAKRYFPGVDPIGQRFEFAFMERTVVGLVGDIRVRGLERESEPQVYLSYRQVGDGNIMFYLPKELVVRASADPVTLVPAVRSIIRKADPDMPISLVRTLDEVVAADSASRTIQLRVLGVFAGLSLLLAGIGLHGLLSFAVSQRVPEISLRMALGARAGDVLRLVLRQGLVLAAIGAVVGMTLAYAAGRWMEALLAGVKPGDLITFAAAAGIAVLMTVSGSLIPALRAVRVDPATVLRAE
ncbi:MAG TPA: ABC transporter permease [Vicinamibacterales bacterium]|jgi:putative ABC transport system permease protein|nr:ABC transporter permease [Vicinamibacterales bacterium]